MAQIPMSETSFDTFLQAGLAPVDTDAAGIAAIHANIFNGEVLSTIYEGKAPGIRLLGLTNKRLIMLESVTKDDRLALTSVPLARITSVSYLAGGADQDPDRCGIDQATTVAIKVLYLVYELVCRDAETAREVHDQLAWDLIAA